jgi:hypothetical protein
MYESFKVWLKGILPGVMAGSIVAIFTACDTGKTIIAGILLLVSIIGSCAISEKSINNS